MFMLVIIVGLSSVIGGFLVGRRPLVFIAPAVWALFMLGLTQAWWGHVGDGWQYALVIGAATAAAGAATGVLVRRATHPRRDGTLREGIS
jgi:hypothetical protein